MPASPMPKIARRPSRCAAWSSRRRRASPESFAVATTFTNRAGVAFAPRSTHAEHDDLLVADRFRFAEAVDRFVPKVDGQDLGAGRQSVARDHKHQKARSEERRGGAE